MTAEALQELFFEASARSDLIALETPEERVSWGELAGRAAWVETALVAAGVFPGDAVALWLPNGADWLAGFWGILRGGFVAVPLSTYSPPREVARLLRHADARALLTTAGFSRIDIAGLWQQLEGLSDLLTVLLSAPAGQPELPAVVRRWEHSVAVGAALATNSPWRPAAGIAAIQYTSGTTGAPKGALLPAAGLARAARAHAADWHLVPGEAIFVPNPFSHILGLTYGVATAAAAGATTLTLSAWDGDAALDLLAAGGAVAMTGAPAHLQMLAEHPRLADLDLSSLRLAMTGGAPLEVEWARRIRQRLGLVSLVNGYGMSEVGSVAQTALDDPPEVAASCVGTAMPGLELRLVDPASGAETAVGEVGELWIRGPSVMVGYHREAALTAAALAPGGWLRSGDLLRRREDGRLAFVGRRAEVIAVGGFDVLPGEVEATLVQHPGVAEAQVVGVPDELLGAVPVAFVRPAGAAPAAGELQAFCLERLRRYMVPRRFVIVEALPRTPTGKVDRMALRRLAAQEIEG